MLFWLDYTAEMFDQAYWQPASAGKMRSTFSVRRNATILANGNLTTKMNRIQTDCAICGTHYHWWLQTMKDVVMHSLAGQSCVSDSAGFFRFLSCGNQRSCLWRLALGKAESGVSVEQPKPLKRCSPLEVTSWLKAAELTVLSPSRTTM